MTTISTPSTSSVAAGSVSSAGVGSGLDVTTIVKSLMVVETQPKDRLVKKEASYTTLLSAYGTLSSSLSNFQTTVSGLSDITKFQALSATAVDTSVFSATVTPQASAGTHSVNVTQLAQAQSLLSKGQNTISGAIGSGSAATVSFQFGTIAGGSYGTAAVTGTPLVSSTALNGIAANSLSINGTTITTGATTTSAPALAIAINLKTATTGVTATPQTTDTGALGSDFVTTSVDGYSLAVGLL
jgi:flagellar hook-associated protein 2